MSLFGGAGMGTGIGALASWAAETEAEFDPNQVTPGWEGFVMTALFAVAIILLGTFLVRRLRRNQYREEVREEIAAELADRDGAGEDPAAGERTSS